MQPKDQIDINLAPQSFLFSGIRTLILEIAEIQLVVHGRNHMGLFFRVNLPVGSQMVVSSLIT